MNVLCTIVSAKILHFSDVTRYLLSVGFYKGGFVLHRLMMAVVVILIGIVSVVVLNNHVLANREVRFSNPMSVRFLIDS
jgi:hypothetical protein